MINILKLNKISDVITDIFDDNYNLSDSVENPTGILLRSFKMHDYKLADSVLAIGRAGAGVNNIPISDYAKKGVVVFNTPGANSNAVKELVICGLLISARDILGGANYANTLNGNPDAKTLVEKNKSQFAGSEIAGKTIGIVGLGAIGRKVAETCLALGMNVVGYDPYLTECLKEQLHEGIKTVDNLEDLYPKCNYVTLHIPFLPSTKNIINKDAFAKMKKGTRLMNFSRGELVNNEDLYNAIDNGIIAKYVTDFANSEVLGKENIIALPHLGASTKEAEDNCAIMAANQIKNYIELGNIVNSVNFPNVSLKKASKYRVTISFNNVKNMINTFSGVLNDHGYKIVANASGVRENIGYAILDIDKKLDDECIKDLKAIENVVKVRVL